MLRSNILAHRGLWSSSKAKNSREALFNALDLGYGIETDVRDLNGHLVISHDPATIDNSFLAEDLFSYYFQINCQSTLALNIKSDGLQALLGEAIDKTGVSLEHLFAFDMSIPDLYQYLRTNVPRYTRISDVEPEPLLIESCQGIWLDNFNGTSCKADLAAEYLVADVAISFVSPELHGRGHEPVWSKIKEKKLHEDTNFFLCTDFPESAYDYFEDTE